MKATVIAIIVITFYLGMLTIKIQLEVVASCRVGSEGLKVYTRKQVERLIDVQALKNIYWDEEPLEIRNLAKATGLDIILAETRFIVDEESRNSTNNKQDPEKETKSFLRDVFVTCSTDRDRSYTLTINLEIENPFKIIESRFKDANSKTGKTTSFKIKLENSTFLVQLKQRIKYDECLDVNYVQLMNLSYLPECTNCTDLERENLEKIVSKRANQLDGEIDTILSEKMLFGLQILLNQRRIDLDLFLEGS